MDENVEFGNPANIGKRPIRVSDTFHSQFQLARAVYRDSNNFLEYNKVTTRDSRLLPYIQDNYKFLKLEKGPVWTSSSYTLHHRLTDDGIHFREVEEDILFGTYFFLSNVKTEHQRNLFNFVSLLSQLGGIYATLFAAFSAVGKYVNT